MAHHPPRGHGYGSSSLKKPRLTFTGLETLLDLLDLYTNHRASTIVGQDHSLETFLAIRIALNREASANNYPRYTNNPRKKSLTNSVKPTNGISDTDDSKSPISPRDGHQKDGRPPSAMAPTTALGNKGRAGLRDGTVRFMLDAERAREEKTIVAPYFSVRRRV